MYEPDIRETKSQMQRKTKKGLKQKENISFKRC